MDLIGLELNDAALTFEGPDGLLRSEPGIARNAEGRVVFGTEAAHQARLHPATVRNRYWHELDRPALVPPLPGYDSPSALAVAQLTAMEADLGIGRCPAVLVVPDHWQREQLARVVGLFAGNSLTVQGLVPASVASTRRRYEGALAWHLELRMHETVLSPLNQESDQVMAGEPQVVAGLGLAALQQRILAGISELFVAESRFDPLHDAQTEQSLADRVDDWSQTLIGQDALTAELKHGGRSYTVRLTRDDFQRIQGAAAEPVVRALRSMLPASGTSVVQANALLARFPGVLERVKSIAGASVFVLEPGAGARGARRRFGGGVAEGASLVTRLPMDQPAVTGLDAAGMGETNTSCPTHLVSGGRAFRLGGRSLSVGSQLEPGEFGVVLDGRTAGVSRRHCVIEIQDGKALVFDQSRYGTMLNGHPVNGSAVLQPGDIISIGTPPAQLMVTAEVTEHGA